MSIDSQTRLGDRITIREAFAELSDFDPHPASVRLLPCAFCRRHGVAILSHVGPAPNTPVILGAAWPEKTGPLRETAELLGRSIEVVRLNLYEIDRVLRSAFADLSPVAPGEDVRRIALDLPAPAADATATVIVDALLADAVRVNASDIHLERYVADVDLRYRIDGILHQCFTHISPTNASEVVSRVKILADLDIAERRRPQDGRFRVLFTKADRVQSVDFRVSVVPSPVGEDIVIRVLDTTVGLFAVDELGMSSTVESLFRRLLANPEGLFLVTGPTSSGKTTTLYSALVHMSDQSRKIITVEDPIEYYVDRVNQKQVSAQVSMQDLLRAVLRQNPDVMLIGELRDRQSADIALEAAGTGHLVLGTLHAPDSLGAISRLRGMGVDDSDIAANLVGIIGQRLARRICAACSASATLTEDQERLFGCLAKGIPLRKGKGCEACRYTGYRGRIGLYELIAVDETMQGRIADGAGLHEIRRCSRDGGFQTLTHDGLAKVAQGMTTLEELVRVVPYRQIVLARDDVAVVAAGQSPEQSLS